MPDIREDLDEALSWIERYSERAASQGVQLLCFPECFLQGYLVEHELAHRHALDLSSVEFERVLGRLSQAIPMLVIGLIEREAGKLVNTAVVIEHGKLLGRYRKRYLLEGEQVFERGTSSPIYGVEGLRFGINICYDTNFSEAAHAIATQGGKLIVCPANNMMGREKAEKFRYAHNEVRSARAKEVGLWLISSDVTGERGDQVSYGPTAVISPDGQVVAQVPLLETGMVVAEIAL